MAKIRVVLADDHAVLRSGLRLLINTQRDMEVVGEAGSHHETLEAVRQFGPDVLLLDLTMPGGSGTKLIDTLSREYPGTRVLVLTMHDDPAYFRQAMAAGAAGYLVKKAADTDLLTAIRTVAQGRVYAPPDLALEPRGTRGQGLERPGAKTGGALESLSVREREVLALLAEGHTNQAIADRLYLSVKTVESYRARVMGKLGLRNRAELTRFALEVGLLSRESTAD